MWSVLGIPAGFGRHGDRAREGVVTKLLQWSRPEMARSEAEGSSRMEGRVAVTKERAEICDSVDRGCPKEGPPSVRPRFLILMTEWRMVPPAQQGTKRRVDQEAEPWVRRATCNLIRAGG